MNGYAADSAHDCFPPGQGAELSITGGRIGQVTGKSSTTAVRAQLFPWLSALTTSLFMPTI